VTDFSKLSKTQLHEQLSALQKVAREYDDAKLVLHDLQVHQIELEMQNRELQETQQELEEARNRYMDLYDFAPVGYLTLDPRGRVLAINLTGAAMLGKKRSTIQGKPLVPCFTNGQSNLFFQHLRRVFQTKDKIATELVVKKNDDEHLDLRLESVIDGNGATCRSAMIDISERKRAENALRQAHDELEQRINLRTQEITEVNRSLQEEIAERKKAEQRLRQAATVFENIDEGILITGADKKIIAVNKAFTDICGYDEAEVLGRDTDLLRSGRHEEAFYTDLWQTLREQGKWRGEIWNRRKNGEVFPAWQSFSAIRNGSGQISNVVSILSDISQIKQAEERLTELAHHDALTGLPNRLLFTAHLDQALERAKRHRHRIALLFLDLDRFKIINDTLGHDSGDELLKTIATRLQQCVRAEDTVARLGGDEFTVILNDITHSEDAGLLAEKMLQAVVQPVSIGGREIVISTSIGISIYPEDAKDSEGLIKCADAAMYRAKEHGRNNYQFYMAELTHKAFEHFSFEQGLRHALEQNEFLLHYQPQVSLSNGKIVGVEALLRWQHPELGMLFPERFIQVAEETGLIEPIGEWVLQEVCNHAKQWHTAGLPPLRFSVNLSGRQILRTDIPTILQTAIENARIKPGELQLELEITESLLQISEQAVEIFKQLKSRGVTLAIDDFGTGYSSLSHIKHLPVDTLKIDRSFVQDIPHDPDDEAIAAAIIAMGHSLKLNVIAEGAETQDQVEFLRSQGCDEVQGFLFSKPVQPEQMYSMLQQNEGGARLNMTH
jgi:diguanylate cyclase (GGDEF)-like protein/PAS domain S-box-containing protein